jgi:integrase
MEPSHEFRQSPGFANRMCNAAESAEGDAAVHPLRPILAVAPVHVTPLLWLDWSGARVASVGTLTVGDYDEPRQRVRLRRKTTKNRMALWVDLPPAFAAAFEATLDPREDRDQTLPLFPGADPDALRTAIARACRACAVPLFSPHALRHRRISLLHRQGRSWAEIARFVGQRKLSVTADTYTHVLVDGREIDYVELVGEV